MDAMTDFLTGYVVAAGAGLAGDPGRSPRGTARCLSAAGAEGLMPRQAASCSSPPPPALVPGRGAGPAELPPITVPGSIEDYFREINAAGDDERTRISERHGIRVVPG